MAEFKAIPRFNNHGATCKGHSNFMLDCEFISKNDRESMIKAIDASLESLELEIHSGDFRGAE